MVPSIKGSLFSVVVEELHEHLDAGRISRDAAEAMLLREDLAAIGEKIRVGTWYPIDLHDRVLRLLCQTVGAGRREYLVEGGRRAADALAESGLYAQLEVKGDDSRLREFSRILVTLSGAIYSFSSWHLVDSDAGKGSFSIDVTDATALPDLVVARAEGFVERAITNAFGGDWEVTSQRPSPDHIILEGWRVAL